MAHTRNPSTQEAGAGELPQVWKHSRLHTDFQDSLRFLNETISQNKQNKSQVWWHKSVIPVTWESTEKENTSKAWLNIKTSLGNPGDLISK